MRFRRRTAAVAVAFAAWPAIAQIDLPDAVADGFYVTLEEVRANSRAVFDAFPGGDAGRVLRSDFVGMTLPDNVRMAEDGDSALAELFDVLDENEDGVLTEAEWHDQINRDLAFLDEDEDGRITLRELADARENIGVGDAIDMVF